MKLKSFLFVTILFSCKSKQSDEIAILRREIDSLKALNVNIQTDTLSQNQSHFDSKNLVKIVRQKIYAFCTINYDLWEREMINWNPEEDEKKISKQSVISGISEIENTEDSKFVLLDKFEAEWRRKNYLIAEERLRITKRDVRTFPTYAQASKERESLLTR